MRSYTLKNKKALIWISLILNGLFYLLLAVKFDIQYDINDDVMIQDILSGAFLLEPSAYTVYMNYILSIILATCYKVFPIVPWLGLFFVGVYLFCMTAILNSILHNSDNIWTRVLLGLNFIGLIGTLFLKNMVLMHYTILAAVVGGTALFLFILSKDTKGSLSILKQNTITMILLVLCYMIRSQVFLMLLPFLGAAGFYKLLLGEKFWLKLKDYIPLIGLTFTMILLVFGIGKLPYQNQEWITYQEFNDARTEVYDYTKIAIYEKHQSFFETLGINEQQVDLMNSYDLLLDDSITTKQLHEIANYTDAQTNLNKSVKSRIRFAFYDYVKSMLLESENMPLNYIVLSIYVFLMIFYVITKRYKELLSLMFLGFARSFVWIYLLYEKRFPERISMSLYIIEFLLLFGMFFHQYLRCKNIDFKPTKIFWKWTGIFFALVLGATSLYFVGRTQAAYEEQYNKNIVMKGLYEYFEANPENFYFLDVYSVAKYSEPVFEWKETRYQNSLLLGGWVTESPLVDEKIGYLGTDSSLKALLEKEEVYFVMNTEYSTKYIEEYLKTKDSDIMIQYKDEVNIKDTGFTIYELQLK